LTTTIRQVFPDAYDSNDESDLNDNEVSVPAGQSIAARMEAQTQLSNNLERTQDMAAAAALEAENARQMAEGIAN
jgi:hypothetical protein